MEKKFAFAPRIIRSPWADFYGREIETAIETHPDEYLRNVAEMGYSGVWLHAELRHMVPTKLSPEVGFKKIDQIRRFADKLRKFNLKLYFYALEPRAPKANDPIWKKYPELRGQPQEFKNIGPKFDAVYYSLCSSTPAVQEYLEEGMYTLFSKVPGLGGIFCITASELHTHCYSHYIKSPEVRKDPSYAQWIKQEPFQCSRCRDREPSDVAAEVITLMNRGVKRANPDADVIAWTWSWIILEPDPQPGLISKLPKDVILMSDWERGGSKNVCGKTYVLDEYSLSYPGPSPRYKKQLAIAHKNGLRMMAKLQIGATHEFAAVPYLPLPHLVANKLRGLRQNKVDGYLACWIFGGEVSPMSKVVGKMSRLPQLPPDKAVREVAVEEFGTGSADAVVRAWKSFAAGWREYPFSVPFIYSGTMNWAVGYPLSLSLKKRPPIPNWLPLPRDKNGHLESGDFFDEWAQPFSPRVIIGALEALLAKWDRGIAVLERAVQSDPDNRRLRLELNLARYIAVSLRCVANQTEFFPLYRKYQKAANQQTKAPLLKKLIKVLERELDYTVQGRECVAFDPRLGFHAEANENLYTLDDVDYKIGLLKSTITSANKRLKHSRP